MSADYSQIELRVLAHLSGDKNLAKAFKEGLDIHAFTASLVFGIEEKDVTTEMRNMANKLLLSNAAQVATLKKDPDHLYYLDFASLLLTGPAALIAEMKAHPIRTTGIIVGMIAFVSTVVAIAVGRSA